MCRMKILAEKILFKQLNSGAKQVAGGGTLTNYAPPDINPSDSEKWTPTEDVVILGCTMWIGVADGATFEAGQSLRLVSPGQVHATFIIHKHSDAPYQDHETVWFPLGAQPHVKSGQTVYMVYDATNTGAATASIHFVINVYYVKLVDY